jgi:UTP--glucose-1-phosphate uridylyltransferase
LEQRLWFADLPDPLGYRHAVWSARPVIEDEPFLLLLGDHLYISSEPRRCGRQVLDLAAAEDCAVLAVRATREHLIHQYGTLPGKRRYDRPDVYAIEEIKDVNAPLRLKSCGFWATHSLAAYVSAQGPAPSLGTPKGS